MLTATDEIVDTDLHKNPEEVETTGEVLYIFVK